MLYRESTVLTWLAAHEAPSSDGLRADRLDRRDRMARRGRLPPGPGRPRRRARRSFSSAPSRGPVAPGAYHGDGLAGADNGLQRRYRVVPRHAPSGRAKRPMSGPSHWPSGRERHDLHKERRLLFVRTGRPCPDDLHRAQYPWAMLMAGARGSYCCVPGRHGAAGSLCSRVCQLPMGNCIGSTSRAIGGAPKTVTTSCTRTASDRPACSPAGSAASRRPGRPTARP